MVERYVVFFDEPSGYGNNRPVSQWNSEKYLSTKIIEYDIMVDDSKRSNFGLAGGY